MKSPFYFIVEPVEGKRYNNTKNISGLDFITSTSEEDFTVSNRKGKVKEVPLNYQGPIKIGDILLVHHNVFKYYNDMKGRQKSGKSFFKDNLFFIDNDQFFMYNQNNQWYSHDRYCFVKPIKKQKSFMFKRGKEEPLMGEMVFTNDYLLSQGIKPGAQVSFQPDSEYEFDVDGEKLYRMYDHQITMTI
tara:strand:+ start:3142 stop:3705 length:564 start_codon:yes stop_codon:yes gene_type:complete